MPRPKGGLGHYCAHVKNGETKEIQIQRLNGVPDQYRKDVIRHMRTVVALQNNKKGRK